MDMSDTACHNLKRAGLYTFSFCLFAFALLGGPGHSFAGERAGQRHGLAPQAHQPISAPSIQALAVAGNQTVYAGSFGLGVYRSDDRGRSWVAVNSGLGDPFILSLATAQDGSVYVGTFRAGVFRSRNGGKSWQEMNSGLKNLEIKVLLVQDGIVYAGTGGGVYFLAEGHDAQWATVTKGLDETLVHSLAMGTDRTLYAGTSGKGVFRYKQSSSHEWTRMSKGLTDHEGLVENFIRVLALDREQALYAGTFDGGVFRSADGGQTWRPISRALPNDSIRGIVATANGLYVATGRGIYKTEDRGHKWLPLNKGLTELSVQVLVASADGVLYAGTSAGVFRSDNEGKNWVGASERLQGEVGSPFRGMADENFGKGTQ
jgi:photosystem II stability/assembly factor-like uncharacterized protein